MNKITKKCMFITPYGVEMKLSSGTILRPNTKVISFSTTGEILTAMNAGIRVFEIGSDGERVKIDKFNFDKINVKMNYDCEKETAKETPAVEETVAPVEETPTPAAEEDPADLETPEDDEPEEEEATPQEDPEAKYYNGDDDSDDDCDEEKPSDEDDEYNVD